MERGVCYYVPVTPRSISSESWQDRKVPASVFMDEFYEEDINQSEEDRILINLLEAFPDVSLERLAAAYTRSDKDPDMTALYLTQGTGGTPDTKAYILSSNPSTIRKGTSNSTDARRGKSFATEILSNGSEILHNGHYPRSAQNSFLDKYIIEEDQTKFDLSFRTASKAILSDDSQSKYQVSVDRDFSYCDPSSPSMNGRSELPEAVPTPRNDGVTHSLAKKNVTSTLSASAPVYEFRGTSRLPSLALPPRVGAPGAQVELQQSIGTLHHLGTKVLDSKVENMSASVSGANAQYLNEQALDWRAISVTADSIQVKKDLGIPESALRYTNVKAADSNVPSVGRVSPQPNVQYHSVDKLNGYTANFSPPPFRQAVQPSTLKMSAVTGSVSSQMQRRNGTYANARAKDIDSRKRKKKMGVTKDAKYSESVDPVAMKAAEEFLYSMLDGTLTADLIRDVLEHFCGDTEKAIETLILLGSSSSSGFPRKMDPDKDSDKDSDKVSSPRERDLESPTEGGWVETGETGRELITQEQFPNDATIHLNAEVVEMLHKAFPGVEPAGLTAVLEVANYSYEEAVKILEESGQVSLAQQRKLEATDVLQAIFGTASVLDEIRPPVVEPPPCQEPWSAVAAKVRRPRPTGEKVPPKSVTNDGSSDFAHHRSTANELWSNMKHYMRAAAAAYAQGDRSNAGRLAAQGTEFKKLARQASHRASDSLFIVKNKDLENNIFIDLHAQFVKDAIRILDTQMFILCKVPSISTISIITGNGVHSAYGVPKIKPAVISYLQKRGVPWKESNPGCLVVVLAEVPVKNSKSSYDSDDSSS